MECRYTFLLFLVSLNILLAIIVESFLRVKQVRLLLGLISKATPSFFNLKTVVHLANAQLHAAANLAVAQLLELKEPC